MKRALLLCVGLLLGALLAEALFSLRDGGAFPHLNIYVSDPVTGVALQPHAEQRLGFARADITTVRTNAQGFRGADWPAPGAQGAILIVGDSQVFGLGVEDDATFSAELARLSKRTVLNAGVPTYGPHEYTEVARRVLAERPVATLVYVVNIANDLFEANRLNRDRHAVWDGWAVRKETAPEQVTQFPFRQWLMAQSHAMFALRRLLNTDVLQAQQLASEGTWRDMFDEAKQASTLPIEQTARELAAREQSAATLVRLAQEIEAHFSEMAEDKPLYAQRVAAITKGNPRDILSARYAEEARPVDVIAYNLLAATLARDSFDAELRALATANRDEALLALLDKRRALRTAMAETATAGTDGLSGQPIVARLREVAALAKAHQAELVVVALPLDVQVSPEEWKKYGKPPMDMTPTRVLLRELQDAAALIGARSLDATEALAAAEPGAFIDGDLHMTAKGHAALAAALRATIEAPAPSPLAVPLLPQGRSWPPKLDELLSASEIVVKGSSAANCETKRVREWLSVWCKPKPSPTDPYRLSLQPSALELRQGGHGDALAAVNSQGVWLIAPVLPGDTLEARLYWREHAQTLSVSATGGMLRGELGAIEPLAVSARPKHGSVQPADIRVAAMASARDPHCRGPAPDLCAFNNPTRPQSCPAGTASFGALRRCRAPCDGEHPCRVGRCERVQDSSACVEP